MIASDFPIFKARTRRSGALAFGRLDVRSVTTLLAIASVLPLPFVAVAVPGLLIPGGLPWMLVVWTAMVGVVVYIAIRGSLNDVEFAVIGTAGILGIGFAAHLMAHYQLAYPILALAVVIPTIAALTPSIPLIVWLLTCAVGTTVSVAIPGEISAGELVIGFTAALSAITLPVILIATLRSALHSQLAHEATLSGIDPLTGLLNRRGFFREHALQQPAENEVDPFGILLIDIDNFKRINDELGHVRGDIVLRDVADTLARTVPDRSLTCRYGGEEFLVFVPAETSAALCEITAKLRSAIAASTPVTVSVGGVHVPHPVRVDMATGRRAEHRLEDLIDRADDCGYQAKRAGRDCSVVKTLAT
ncbi:GGDEF domain-containing protein [Gordonia alkaliphila]|uniref:GGDEF domain-containing protein n=1 Tax=Gordonia alkaliphila TaxID=1053547 RepID=UPI001FF43D33|nr:GGDEF domain-containing protein [Gordonia alkaliphila]MCK0438371.1 GGDEF domain-containing protein [Gordonia alkaliphila]